MEVLFKHFWILGLLMNFISGLYVKYWSRKYIIENPDLKEGYDKYFVGHLIFGSIPWVIIMIGSLSGMAQNVFEYLFNSSIVVLIMLSLYWIFIKDGARFLEKHYLVRFRGYKEPLTASQIKLFYPIILLLALMGFLWN